MAVYTMRNTCKKYMNRTVQIKTIHGNYIGKIVKVDNSKVYLKVSSLHKKGKAHTSFFPFIIPLVLFDLLAIILLDSRRRIL
ncbi:hypothetical protein J2Z66_004346 [Paenibacillus eucommiae]|uniref:KOW domain-containing protein n=1 Tax=Paenibacillus eucommiae TaxID=1355755 RepID=A0ABS4IYS4_9BACL|nr:hypothetical protein [Paenibacillus eucommiae]